MGQGYQQAVRARSPLDYPAPRLWAGDFHSCLVFFSPSRREQLFPPEPLGLPRFCPCRQNCPYDRRPRWVPGSLYFCGEEGNGAWSCLVSGGKRKPQPLCQQATALHPNSLFCCPFPTLPLSWGAASLAQLAGSVLAGPSHSSSHFPAAESSQSWVKPISSCPPTATGPRSLLSARRHLSRFPEGWLLALSSPGRICGVPQSSS